MPIRTVSLCIAALLFTAVNASSCITITDLAIHNNGQLFSSWGSSDRMYGELTIDTGLTDSYEINCGNYWTSNMQIYKNTPVVLASEFYCYD